MIRIQVSYVLQFVDDYTKKILSGNNLLVRGGNGERPIRKEGGYYVFCGCPGPLDVTVSSPFYLEKRLSLERGNEKIIKIRLKPGRNYPLPEGAVFLEGTARPGSLVGAVIMEEESLWKLLFDYTPKKDGEQLKVYHPSPGDVTGMQFIITDGKKKEFFQVKAVKKGQFLLKEPLLKEYKKTGTLIRPFYNTISDEKGSYFLPMDVRLKGATPCRLYLNGQEREDMLEPGRNIRKDFMGEAKSRQGGEP